MLNVHPYRARCGSWCCPKCAPGLGRALCEHLQQAEINLHARGERFVLVGLTIDPKRFDSPLAAMTAVKGKRSIARCFSKWGKRRGIKAYFLGKLELNQSGWPHWHVLLIVPDGFRFANPKQGAGEFDDCWPHGISDVDWRDLGGLAQYGSKLASYVTKGAGHDGHGALAASGIPATGYHFVQPSHGFWAYCGVDAFDARRSAKWDDEVVASDDGTIVGAVGRKGPRWGSHVERVQTCGATSCLVVSGGMRDERPRSDGGHGSTFTIELPCTRGILGTALDFFSMQAECEVVWVDRGYGPPPGPGWAIVQEVKNLRPKDLLRFLDFLAFDFGVSLDGVDRGWVRRRLGWLTSQAVGLTAGGAGDASGKPSDAVHLVASSASSEAGRIGRAAE